jgi:endonuclease/exonuclease/phosphatase family metal-dependent hydrolase
MHRIDIAWKGPLGALAVIGMVTFGPPSPTGAEASGRASPGPSILTYNVCGGSCTKRMSLDEWNSRIIDQMESSDADVVLLQELCRGQYVGLQRALGDGYESRWAGTMSDNQGCGDQWSDDLPDDEAEGFGIGIFIKGSGSIGPTHRIWLPNENDDEPRALMCVDARLRGRYTRVCNTHLDWHPDTEATQAAYVSEIVRPWAREMPLVFGGDLNAVPTSAAMAHFYGRTAGAAALTEVDESDRNHFGSGCGKQARHCRSGEATRVGRKIDYIFLSRSHFYAANGQVAQLDRDLSDHSMLQGAASWRRETPLTTHHARNAHRKS